MTGTRGASTVSAGGAAGAGAFGTGRGACACEVLGGAVVGACLAEVPRKRSTTRAKLPSPRLAPTAAEATTVSTPIATRRAVLELRDGDEATGNGFSARAGRSDGRAVMLSGCSRAGERNVTRGGASSSAMGSGKPPTYGRGVTIRAAAGGGGATT